MKKSLSSVVVFALLSALSTVALAGDATEGALPKGDAPAELPDGPRFRFGADAFGGMSLVSAGATPGFAGTLGGHLRLGAQVSHLFAFYYQPSAYAMMDSSGTLFLHTHGLLPEVTFAHVIQLGGGPTLDVFHLPPNSGGVQPRPGLDVHFGVTFGGRAPRRRVSFLVGFDNHVSFLSRSATTWQMGMTLGVEVH